MSPSHQNAYIERVEEASKEVTRVDRIAKVLRMMARRGGYGRRV